MRVLPVKANPMLDLTPSTLATTPERARERDELAGEIRTRIEELHDRQSRLDESRIAYCRDHETLTRQFEIRRAGIRGEETKLSKLAVAIGQLKDRLARFDRETREARAAKSETTKNETTT